MQFSPQQNAFLDWATSGTGSCVLEAVAGAGKTTTILEAAARMAGQVAILAYNKKISEEIKAKLVKRGLDYKKAQAGTVHSFGFSALRKAFPGVRVADDKVFFLIPENMKTYSAPICALVSHAKQRALGVVGPAVTDRAAWWDIAEHHDTLESEEPGEAIITTAIQVLQKSSRDTATIDFDDMVYLPLVHRCRFWQFDVVMVDEAQDTNPARRALVRALVRRGGRVIAVGDRHQAIYGFTGADAQSLDLIAQDFACVRLPLTTTYRCPKTVVEFAQQWVSHITAAETAPEGSVTSTTMEDFMVRNDLTEGSAVLCRNTKPLVALAFALIRRRIACRVEGRDVGASIKKLVLRWRVKTLEALQNRLETYLERETTKLLAKKQEARLQTVEDTVETIKIIIQQCQAEGRQLVSDAVAYIDQLFGDGVTGMLVLSTIHKSKGREWERVYWLDRRNTCPSKWARQQWQLDQEHNLCYVAATRAQSELIEIVV